jgi:hypothetical protein
MVTADGLLPVRIPPRTLVSVALLSQIGYSPTQMNEQKIQMMPTVTQPVKKGLEKMYPVPYMGIGQRTRNAMALSRYVSDKVGYKIICRTKDLHENSDKGCNLECFVQFPSLLFGFSSFLISL